MLHAELILRPISFMNNVYSSEVYSEFNKIMEQFVETCMEVCYKAATYIDALLVQVQVFVT